jgi:DNA-binding CsgD family transcriptional regulator
MSLPNSSKSFASFSALKSAVEILSISSSGQDLCRRLTHSEYFKGMCRGVAIFWLDEKSSLMQVAVYGAMPEDLPAQLSAWDDSFISAGLRARSVTYQVSEEITQACLPIEVAGVISGAMLFVLSPDFDPGYPNDDETKLLANLSGLFMDARGLKIAGTETSEKSRPETEEIMVQELTTRQMKILNHVAEGLTNADIGREVLLSESSVRQETIRIFRILKCHTRSEAIVKSRALGIIASVPKINEPAAEIV